MKFIYRQRDSPLSSLNEYTRVVLLLSLFFLSVLFSSIPMQAVVLAAILLTAAAGQVFRPSLAFVRYLIMLSAFIFATSILLAPGGTALLSAGGFEITSSPILFSFSMTLRIVSSVISFNLLLLAVNPDAAIGLISRMGRKTAAALLVATRLMPVLSNEGEEVLQAFESRGISWRQGGWRSRVKSASRMIFPLLYSTMDRSMGVAEAMELRGFPSGWKVRRFHFSLADYAQLFISFAAVLSGISLSLAGVAAGNYYSAAFPGLDVPALLLVAALTFPVTPYLRRWSYYTGKRAEVPLQLQ